MTQPWTFSPLYRRLFCSDEWMSSISECCSFYRTPSLMILMEVKTPPKYLFSDIFHWIYSQTCHLASSKDLKSLVFTIIATFSDTIIYHSLGGVILWKCPGSPERNEKATKQNENCICCHPSRDPLRALSRDIRRQTPKVIWAEWPQYRDVGKLAAKFIICITLRGVFI